MGQTVSYWWSDYKDHWDMVHLTLPTHRLPRDQWPSDREPSPFPPLEGFENGRKPREMIATELEMDSGKLEGYKRDYCAHLYLELKGCMKSNMPMLGRCTREMHAWHDCQWDDQVLRMKEWEREKRLRQRQLKQQMKEEKESLD